MKYLSHEGCDRMTNVRSPLWHMSRRPPKGVVLTPENFLRTVKGLLELRYEVDRTKAPRLLPW